MMMYPQQKAINLIHPLTKCHHKGNLDLGKDATETERKGNYFLEKEDFNFQDFIIAMQSYINHISCI
jgi:hypothetical protein